MSRGLERVRAALRRPGAGWDVLAAALLLLLAALALATFRDYGITWDEAVQHRYGNRLVRWYASGGTDASALRQNNLFYYGGFFELIAQAARRVSPLGVYETRHLVNAAFGLLGIAAAWGLASRLAGARAGFLAAAFLALTPRFYGHWFANPKDLPFASLFALAAWAILAAADRLPRLGWRAVTFTGVAIGAASGVRVAGIVLYAYAAVLWLAIAWSRTGHDAARRTALRRLLGAWLAVVCVGWAVMLAAWPWALVHPLLNPLRALRKLSSFWEDVTILFDGRLLLARDLPRDYVPRLLALTLPEGYLVALLLGIAGGVLLLRRQPAAREAVLRTGWVFSLAAAPIAWTLLRHTPLYNGLRHVLFLLPILAVLAGAGTAAFFEARPPALLRAIAAAALLASAAATVADMVALHPYQYVYFNRALAGGLPRAAPRYETDYWCASFKEGVEWLVREYRADSPGPIRVSGRCSDEQLSYYLAGPEAARFRPGRYEHPDVLFVSTELDRQHARGRVLHAVRRQGVTLLDVVEVEATAP